MPFPKNELLDAPPLQVRVSPSNCGSQALGQASGVAVRWRAEATALAATSPGASG